MIPRSLCLCLGSGLRYGADLGLCELENWKVPLRSYKKTNTLTFLKIKMPAYIR